MINSSKDRFEQLQHNSAIIYLTNAIYAVIDLETE